MNSLGGFAASRTRLAESDEDEVEVDSSIPDTPVRSPYPHEWLPPDGLRTDKPYKSASASIPPLPPVDEDLQEEKNKSTFEDS